MGKSGKHDLYLTEDTRRNCCQRKSYRQRCHSALAVDSYHDPEPAQQIWKQIDLCKNTKEKCTTLQQALRHAISNSSYSAVKSILLCAREQDLIPSIIQSVRAQEVANVIQFGKVQVLETILSACKEEGHSTPFRDHSSFHFALCQAILFGHKGVLQVLQKHCQDVLESLLSGTLEACSVEAIETKGHLEHALKTAVIQKQFASLQFLKEHYPQTIVHFQLALEHCCQEHHQESLETLMHQYCSKHTATTTLANISLFMQNQCDSLNLTP